MPRPSLTPQQVLLLRKQREEGKLDAGRWVRATGLSRETILRAARGDSYASVEEAAPAPADAADDLAAAEALSRLQSTLAAQPPSPAEVRSMLDQMAQAVGGAPPSPKE